MSFDHWSLSVCRDNGHTHFWKWPRLQGWRTKRGGWIIRIGWRWTAWALSYGKLTLTKEEADAIAPQKGTA